MAMAGEVGFAQEPRRRRVRRIDDPTMLFFGGGQKTETRSTFGLESPAFRGGTTEIRRARRLPGTIGGKLMGVVLGRDAWLVRWA